MFCTGLISTHMLENESHLSILGCSLYSHSYLRFFISSFHYQLTSHGFTLKVFPFAMKTKYGVTDYQLSFLMLGFTTIMVWGSLSNKYRYVNGISNRYFLLIRNRGDVANVLVYVQHLTSALPNQSCTKRLSLQFYIILLSPSLGALLCSNLFYLTILDVLSIFYDSQLVTSLCYRFINLPISLQDFLAYSFLENCFLQDPVESMAYSCSDFGTLQSSDITFLVK